MLIITQNVFYDLIIYIMKVNPITQTNHKTTFTSYNKRSSKTGLSVSTSFYLDFPVLRKAVKIIEERFPSGADILVYAGSNGEEAYSINTLLKNPSRYKINSIDICKESIEYANRGVYGIHPLADDGFLIKEDKTNADAPFLKKIFYKYFSEINKPDYNIDNLSDVIYNIRLGNEDLFPQKFFVPNAGIKQNIRFLEGDIRDISDFSLDSKQGKAGAVFFRNALYQLTKNDLRGVMEYGDMPDLIFNKEECLADLIDKVYNKLSIGGIFVMGSHLQEHLYIADKSVPDSKTIVTDAARNIRYMAYPPHIKVLNKNGRFKPLFDYLIQGFGQNLKLPLIWQKIK